MMAQIQLKPALKRKFNQTSASATVVETIQPPRTHQQQAQQQSFAMVYTLLHSSLAQITYLRHLFPNPCFEDRSFDAIRIDAEDYYQHRTSDRPSVKKQRTRLDPMDQPASSRTLKLLVQHSHPGVMTFLHWLNGILQGILKQTTTAAQFCICADPTNRSNILESYTFRFHYHQGRHLADLAVSGSSTSPTSITSARSGLDELFKGISSSIEKMPDLPNTRFLTCHLFHLPEPCCDFQLYGFVLSSERRLTVPDDSDWRPNFIKAGSMDSGHHQVSLNITHMQLVGEDQVNPDDLYGIPERMHYHRTMSRVVDSPQDRAKVRSNDCFPLFGDKSEQPGISYPAWNEGGIHIPPNPLDTLGSNPSKGRTLPETSPSTIIANLTKGCSHVSQSVQDDFIATQRLPAPDPSQHYIRLSRETARRLEERGAPDWTASEDGEHVYCQCNFNQEEGKIVQCTYCKNWQHDHCYGYISSVLPDADAHACYRCLFAQDDPTKLRQLENLALARRCLWLLYGPNPPSTQAELKRRLRMLSAAVVQCRMGTDGA
ncbi:hypothetical protein XPA_005970 [Xanthoria parietina]